MSYQLIHGEALAELQKLESDSVDLVCIDPPYSSGGAWQSTRNQQPNQKYTQTGTRHLRPEFSGDNRDARSYRYWLQLVLSETLRITRKSGYLQVFTDWRQLPTTADAIQAGGWVWRGIQVLNKGRGARAPHTGLPRAQCEYILVATKGVSRPASHGGPPDGCFHFPVLQSDKHHVTGKPTPLLRELIKIVPPGATVLDCFQGSGTTGVACQLEQRNYIGIEQDETYHQIAEKRIREAAEGLQTATLHKTA
jgi:site-specific DNA-methyltransferase (adenine-specific)